MNPHTDSHLHSTYTNLLNRDASTVALEAQRLGGMCPVCERSGPTTTDNDDLRMWWHIDHNHETGQVRGLLCARCNRIMSSHAGQLDDQGQAFVLRRLAEWVEHGPLQSRHPLRRPGRPPKVPEEWPVRVILSVSQSVEENGYYLIAQSLGEPVARRVDETATTVTYDIYAIT